MLVQEPRGGSSLKIIAAVLGVLLCADLIARVPFGSLLAGPEPAVSSTTGAAPVETSVPAANPTRSAARQPELAAAKEPQPAPASGSQIPASVQQPNAAASTAQQPAAQEIETKTTEGLPCEQQTWPYIDSRCKDANIAAPPPANREVRVIGKDSSAPATVVTPLPPDTVTAQPQVPREPNKIDTAAPAPSQPIPSAQQAAAPPANAVKHTDTDRKAADTPSGSIGTAATDLPRPVPDKIRKSVAPESRKTASAPASSNSSLQQSTHTSKQSVGRSTKTTNTRESASKTQKVTSKQDSRSEPGDTEETPWRHEETSWGREEPFWKREETSRGREEKSRKREEAPRGRHAEPRRTDVTESRGYQLPSGRRIIVFRQSNGEVGIAPDTGDSGSFFFGR